MSVVDVQNLAYVGMFAVVVTGFLLVVLTLGRLVRPVAYSEAKSIPYECGMDQMAHPWARFHMRYYYFGLLFVIFDVETVLLFAVATQFRALRDHWAFVTSAVVLFVALVLGALAYAWRRGALKWQ